MTHVLGRRFARYVALGDSSTEGLEDPDGVGGYRGWANRLAERIAAAQAAAGLPEPLLYANLAVRGRRTRRVRDEQLPRAGELRPDLATIFVGTNDVVARRFDAAAFARDLEHMQRTLVAGGATVLGFTLPDPAPVMPLARGLAPRVRVLNDAFRSVSAATGALLVDLAAHPVASDPRLWCEDRLHANPAGHARIAAALAHALALPGADASWSAPRPARGPRGGQARLAAELRWTRRHLVPWLWRHLHGRSAGDGRGPKRPDLLPIAPPR